MLDDQIEPGRIADRIEFEIVVVVRDAQPVRLERGGRLVERLGVAFPVVGGHLAREPHIPCPQILALARGAEPAGQIEQARSEEHTSELQSLMRSSYAVFCLKKNKNKKARTHD